MKRLFGSCSLFLVLLSALTACGGESKKKDDREPSMSTGGDATGKTSYFPPSLLSEFATWAPVLPGDQAFVSAGHGGIIVRSYLNPIALNHAQSQAKPYPMAIGSTLAKAVVSSPSVGVEAASRVYFMTKQPAGFDPEHGDWSYAVANRVNGSLVYDSNVGPRQELCVSCHAKFAEYDYVQTVDFFKRQSVGS